MIAAYRYLAIELQIRHSIQQIQRSNPRGILRCRSVQAGTQVLSYVQLNALANLEGEVIYVMVRVKVPTAGKMCLSYRAFRNTLLRWKLRSTGDKNVRYSRWIPVPACCCEVLGNVQPA